MVHNGVINGFHELRRELVLAVDPSLFAEIRGSTDSEVLFHLALTLGLEDDPVGALEQAIGFVEETAARHGVENAIQASIGVTDGERLWGIRYSTERRSRTLFRSADASAPVVARTWAMNMCDSTCAASSRRFSSPQAGATPW
jgi:glutamine amidotransferase